MRPTTLTLNGVAYPMCFSLRAHTALCEKFGSIDGAFQTIREAGESKDLSGLSERYLWIVELLLKCGQRTAKLDGTETPGPPGADELADRLGVGDLAGLYDKINETIAAGCERQVGALPPKNETATREERKSP